MQIHITECWETRVTIIDKYLSCLRNQAQLLETGTQHYLKFQILDTQVLPSPLSLVGILLTWLALLKAYPCLPSHLKTFILQTLWLQFNAGTKKKLKHSKTAKTGAFPTMKSFSPTLLQTELKILLIKGQTSTDIHRAITGFVTKHPSSHFSLGQV